MGSWGIELFADDVACDVRDDYRELIEDGVNDDDATAQVLERYGKTVADDDDGSVIWLALAVSQWEIGRLAPRVRDRALAVIDSGADLERWSDDPNLLAQRRAVLYEIRQQLTRPQPKRKRLRRPKMRYVTDLHAGDVLSYRGSNGRMALVRVARIDQNRGSVAPILKVLEYCAHTEPTGAEIASLPDRQKPDIEPPPSPSPPWWTVDYRPEADAGVDYHEAGFRRLTNIGVRPGDEYAQAWTAGAWSTFARTLERYLRSEDVD